MLEINLMSVVTNAVHAKYINWIQEIRMLQTINQVAVRKTAITNSANAKLLGCIESLDLTGLLDSF